MIYIFNSYFMYQDKCCYVFEAKNKKELLENILNYYKKEFNDEHDDELAFGNIHYLFVNIKKKFRYGDVNIKNELNYADGSKKEFNYIDKDSFEKFKNDFFNLPKEFLLQNLNIKECKDQKRELLSAYNIFKNIGIIIDIEIYLKNAFHILQYSNDKEKNPIIYKFVNNPLYDRNLFGIINDFTSINNFRF